MWTIRSLIWAVTGTPAQMVEMVAVEFVTSTPEVREEQIRNGPVLTSWLSSAVDALLIVRVSAYGMAVPNGAQTPVCVYESFVPSMLSSRSSPKFVPQVDAAAPPSADFAAGTPPTNWGAFPSMMSAPLTKP